MGKSEEVQALVRQALEEALRERAAAAAPAPTASPAPAGAETVAIGADHGGFGLKEVLIAELRRLGYAVTDCGTYSREACDYPDFAHEVARRVADGACRWGVLVDGAGIGSTMAANKVPGVRAALGYDLSSARNSREHNHANVLCLGAGLIGEALAKEIVATWFTTPWGGERHARRVEKISAIERRYTRS